MTALWDALVPRRFAGVASEVRSGMLSSAQAAPHVPQYDVPPSHSSNPLNPTTENNALSGRLSSATPSTPRGVGPTASFRISPISLSVRILNLSRAVAMDFLAGSKNAHMLRESR